MALVWGTYAARPAQSIRSLALMVAIAAAVFYFVAIMPAFNYHYTAAHSSAVFGAVATLPWPSEASRAVWDALADSGADHALVWDLGTVSVSVAEKSVTGVECRALDPSSRESRELTYHSDRLMVAAVGSGSRDAIVLDSSLARRLDVRLGDRVRVASETQGARPRGPFTAAVVGLVRPTNETSGVLLFAAPAGFPRGGMQVFLGGGGAEESLPEGRSRDHAGFVQRDAALSSGRARLEAVLSRNTRYVLIWVSLAAYFGYQLWDQIDRVADRRKRYAILLSLGLEQALIVRALRFEQLALALVTAPVGCLLGAWALVSASSMYLPTDSLVACVAYALGVNLLAAYAAGVRFRREVRQLPVASLLSGT